MTQNYQYVSDANLIHEFLICLSPTSPFSSLLSFQSDSPLQSVVPWFESDIWRKSYNSYDHCQPTWIILHLGLSKNGMVDLDVVRTLTDSPCTVHSCLAAILYEKRRPKKQTRNRKPKLISSVILFEAHRYRCLLLYPASPLWYASHTVINVPDQLLNLDQLIAISGLGNNVNIHIWETLVLVDFCLSNRWLPETCCIFESSSVAVRLREFRPENLYPGVTAQHGVDRSINTYSSKPKYNDQPISRKKTIIWNFPTTYGVNEWYL